jgi:hypothetical protein
VTLGQGYGEPFTGTADETGEDAMVDIAKVLDKAYEDWDFSRLAEAPVSALQGVSESDAQALKSAFGIDTIRELATNKFVLWAQAINVLAQTTR